MIKSIIIILSLFLFGCYTTTKSSQMVKLPHYKNAWQIQEKNSWPPVNDVSVAVKIFYIKWKKEFGDQDKKVYRALNKLVIEWDNSINREMLGYFVDGKIKRGIIKGIALSPSYIRIYKTDYEKIGSTSLIHELTHIALWNSGNILGDPDHEGLEYSGWTSKHTKMIKDLNRILANIDI